MQNQSSGVKNLIIAIVAIVVLVGGYMLISGPSVAEDNLALVNETIPGSEVGGDLVALLAELRSIQIDKTFFDNKDFKTLQNFSVELPTLPVGRDYPFSPYR